MSFASAHADYLDPDRHLYHDDPPDNKAVTKAFQDYDTPAELARATYKYVACGPAVAFVVYEGDNTRTIYGDSAELRRKWPQLIKKGLLITGIQVSSIVEGVDACTDTITVGVNWISDTPDDIRKRYWDAVDEVDKQAKLIWMDTHGCPSCAKHFGLDPDGFDQIPVYTNCRKCKGQGQII